MKYQAILFDVDGVLVESETSRIKFLKEISEKYGLILSDSDFTSKFGKTTARFFEELMIARSLDKNVVNKILDEYYSLVKPNYINQVSPISTTLDFIREYTGQSKIGIATMNTRSTTIQLTQFYTIDTHVDAIMTLNDVANEKPHPEVYLKLAAALNMNPKECAVIEDSIVGIQAGIAAGMNCYVFLNSYNHKQQFDGLNIAGFISSSADLSALAQ